MDYRESCHAWQKWAADLLDELARQPLYGQHGDDAARDIIRQLALMAPAVPRCSRCGCFATRHEVDDDELRGCVDCECEQFEV